MWKSCYIRKWKTGRAGRSERVQNEFVPGALLRSLPLTVCPLFHSESFLFRLVENIFEKTSVIVFISCKSNNNDFLFLLCWKKNAYFCLFYLVDCQNVTDWRSKVAVLFPGVYQVNSFSTSWLTLANTKREKQYQCFIDLLCLCYFSTPWHKDRHTPTHFSLHYSLFHPLTLSLSLFKPHSHLFFLLSLLWGCQTCLPLLPCAYFCLYFPSLLSCPCCDTLSYSFVNFYIHCLLRLCKRRSLLTLERGGILKYHPHQGPHSSSNKAAPISAMISVYL